MATPTIQNGVRPSTENLEKYSATLKEGFDPDIEHKYTETIRLIDNLLAELEDCVKHYNGYKTVDDLSEGLVKVGGLVNVMTVNLHTLRKAACTIKDNLDEQKQNKMALSDARDELKQLNGEAGGMRMKCADAGRAELLEHEKEMLGEIEKIIRTVVLLTHRFASRAGGYWDFMCVG